MNKGKWLCEDCKKEEVWTTFIPVSVFRMWGNNPPNEIIDKSIKAVCKNCSYYYATIGEMDL